MEQIEFFDIPSPCIGVCTANSKGYCKGCLRSRDERLHWMSLNNEQKKLVIRRCIMRKRKILEQLRAQQATTDEAINIQFSLFDD